MSAPDPLAYGPPGYRCGCGKPAHSNLVPCQPDAKPVAERQLTPDNIEEVDNWLDRADQFAKPYWETVDGRLTVTGLRIGHRPHHVVAKFGDTIVRLADGTHTVRHDSEAGAR